ncbi:MAG: NUDIX hydrolase [Coriobacteriales bacterium]
MGELIEHFEDPSISEKIIGSTRSFEGRLLKVDSVDIELPNGHKTRHEVIRHPGAVCVVALDTQGRVLVVRQYRTALERVTIEVPAGKIDPGEDPEDAVRRELAEETGYVAGDIRRLASIAVAVGYSDEIIHIYMATDLAPGSAHPDDDEFVIAEWVSVDSLIDSVLDGRIEDSKTVIAALICDALRHRM